MLVLVAALGFGGYLFWQKIRRDQAEEARLAAIPPPPPPPKANLAGLPDVKGDKVAEKKDGRIIVIAGPEDEKKTPSPPFRFIDKEDLQEKDVEPKRNTTPSELDKKVWATIAPAKGKSMQKSPFEIPVSDLKRRREIAALISQYEQIPVDECVKHPLADDFPGEVPKRVKRKRITVTMTEGQSDGWVSTGFYAPAGELIRIELSDDDAKRGYRLQIGSHSDTITHTKREAWHRFPQILRSFALNRSEVIVANPFGGLIFITGHVSNIKPERPFQIRYTGVVKAPTFFIGKTTHEEWGRIRSESKGVPWGELVGKYHVAMLPGKQMHDVGDPQPFAEYWDKVVALQDDLTGVKERGRAERFNADAEISVGGGHSGYPWCAYLDWADAFTDRKSFKSDNWGINHEIGHNHQRGEWTFKGYGEVTNNLIGMYVMQTLSGLRFRQINGGDWKNLAIQAIAFQNEAGPFERLAYYIPVIEKFGWEPLKKTFHSYNDEPISGDSDDEKKAEFVYRWSVSCGVDLSEYSVLFGFPKTHLLQYRLKEYNKTAKKPLKVWMPDGYPPPLTKIKRIARQKDPKFNFEEHGE